MFESYNTILDQDKPELSKAEFLKIFERQFSDARFDRQREEILRLGNTAYEIYLDERKTKT